jgi:hypothetical protein
LNVLLLLMSVAVTVAVLAPNRMSSFPLDAEIAVLLGAIAAVIAANVVMLRRLVGPVQTLTRARPPYRLDHHRAHAERRANIGSGRASSDL